MLAILRACYYLSLGGILWLLISPSLSAASQWEGNVALIQESRSLHHKDWKEYPEQSATGLVADFSVKTAPIRVVLYAMHSPISEDVTFDDSEETWTLEGEINEVNSGIRKVIKGSRGLRLFVEGGMGHVTSIMRLEGTGVDEMEQLDSTHVWAGFGLHYQFWDRVLLGITLRGTKSPINTRYTSVGGTLGWSW